MQLGLTRPLQAFLKSPLPPCRESPDLAFCWELHLLRTAGRRGLLLVNASNRFAIYLHALQKPEWDRLPGLAAEQIVRALEQADVPRPWVDRYRQAAGAPELTGTHGRKTVAGLNRVVDGLRFFEAHLDAGSMEQPTLDALLNKIPCHAAGFTEFRDAMGFLYADLERLFSGQ